MMEFPQQVSLKDVASVNGVISASVITRSGEYVEGSMPANARKDTFAAMSAIMLGASERLAIEVNAGLESISVTLNGYRLTIIGLDSQYLMTIVSTPEAEQQEITAAAWAWKEKSIMR